MLETNPNSGNCLLVKEAVTAIDFVSIANNNNGLLIK